MFASPQNFWAGYATAIHHSYFRILCAWCIRNFCLWATTCFPAAPAPINISVIVSVLSQIHFCFMAQNKRPGAQQGLIWPLGMSEITVNSFKFVSVAVHSFFKISCVWFSLPELFFNRPRASATASRDVRNGLFWNSDPIRNNQIRFCPDPKSFLFFRIRPDPDPQTSYIT